MSQVGRIHSESFRNCSLHVRLPDDRRKRNPGGWQMTWQPQPHDVPGQQPKLHSTMEALGHCTCLRCTDPRQILESELELQGQRELKTDCSADSKLEARTRVEALHPRLEDHFLDRNWPLYVIFKLLLVFLKWTGKANMDI